MIRLLAGDCRDVLPTLPAESVQCVVTSPPYYGLRDYGTALWDGGDAGCDHMAPPTGGPNPDRYTTGGGEMFRAANDKPFRDTCGKCGAVRVDRQIGLEASPEAYLATMVQVFREVRRVLRSDGTVWCNLGDSYCGGGGYWPNAPSNLAGSLSAYAGDAKAAPGGALRNTGLAPKQLLLMPARLALALQADGWWVRSDIIWHKPNPMPESVTDRCVSAHEHVFMLTKSARYFFDSDAIREPHQGPHCGHLQSHNASERERDNTGQRRLGKQGLHDFINLSGRSCRNVWTIATHAYPDAHFATFPPELAERCIKAGTSERGCCAACGKPWGRVTEKAFVPQRDTIGGLIRRADGLDPSNGWKDTPRGTTEGVTTGWSPGCQCGTTETRTCVVLDPFAGAGTTLLCSDRLQRDAIGIELNTAYTEMAMERCRADAPLFTSFPPAEDPEESRMADLFAEAAE